MVVKRSFRLPKKEVLLHEQLGPPLQESPQEIFCPLCERKLIPGPTTDEHHLIPKSQGGKDKFLIHRVCHKKIHQVFTEKELMRNYSTWEKLKSHPQMAQFITWVKKRPIDYVEK